MLVATQLQMFQRHIGLPKPIVYYVIGTKGTIVYSYSAVALYELTAMAKGSCGVLNRA